MIEAILPPMAVRPLQYEWLQTIIMRVLSVLWSICKNYVSYTPLRHTLVISKVWVWVPFDRTLMLHTQSVWDMCVHWTPIVYGPRNGPLHSAQGLEGLKKMKNPYNTPAPHLFHPYVLFSWLLGCKNVCVILQCLPPYWLPFAQTYCWNYERLLIFHS